MIINIRITNGNKTNISREVLTSRINNSSELNDNYLYDDLYKVGLRLGKYMSGGVLWCSDERTAQVK